jgi:hypothetical protein
MWRDFRRFQSGLPRPKCLKSPLFVLWVYLILTATEWEKMVDKAECWENRAYLPDFISFRPNPKLISNAELRQKYLQSNLSSQQLADEYGVSKQMILGRLRQAGVHGGKARGRAADNFRFPNPPYGYRVVNGRLETHPGELKVVRLIVELRDRKGWSFPAIAEELNQRGLGTRQGCRWIRSTVRLVHKAWKDKL